MKKILTAILTITMILGLFTACSGGGTDSDKVTVELNQVGTSLALAGTFNNVTDEDVSATITVNWYDEQNESIGCSIASIPYIAAGDTAFDVFDFGELYDTYDYTVETGEVTDEAKEFYGNLTVESDMKADGTVDYTVGGGHGEKFKASVVILYTDQDDKVIAYDSKVVKGSGTASGTFKGCKDKNCCGYRMNMILM